MQDWPAYDAAERLPGLVILRGWECGRHASASLAPRLLRQQLFDNRLHMDLGRVQEGHAWHDSAAQNQR
jgi:hypothetical protein